MTTRFASMAEQKGIILIYPETTMDSRCWDCSSEKTLRHDGGGDSHSIANMVRYVIKKYNADPTRVYATGLSSGAMMTNVLMATYPDLFAGGAAFSGVAAGCLKYTLNTQTVQGVG